MENKSLLYIENQLIKINYRVQKNHLFLSGFFAPPIIRSCSINKSISELGGH
jgi:hypothetical protein